MTIDLLRTKLYIPPTRPELVSRPRLMEQLNTGLGRKLTLISAPVGFGKTTLVSEWVHTLRSDAAKGSQSGIRSAWLSLDAEDSDPTRFLAYFVAALQTIEARQEPASNTVKELLKALHSPQPPPPGVILTTLINEIALIPGQIVLVLDDYHLIEVQPVHDTLAFLLRHLPPHMHLVIATREDPPLSLSRLRARNQMTELRATDLRFVSSEAAEFLNRVMGLNLSGEDIAALESRTEGWIAGLQLAALSMRGCKDAASFIKSFTGSHRFVLDYLSEEVLHRQSESVQTFLLQTSVLDRLTGSLCDAVRFDVAEAPGGSEGSAAILAALDAANLFIVPLDEERRWYRYHQLFADLLRRRLRQTFAEQVPLLYRRASEWHDRNGFSIEAIEYALRGEDFERAAYLIEREAEAVWGRGEDKLLRWLNRLPAATVLSRPQLCVFHAWTLFAAGNQDAAERSLQVAEQALDACTDRATGNGPRESGRVPGSEQLKLRGRVAATRAFLAFYRGDVQEIVRYSVQALEHLPEQDLAWRSAAAGVLGDARDFEGEMAAAYQARLEALEVSKAAGNSYQIIIANLKLSVILSHQGRLRQVIEICRQQMQVANESGMAQTFVVGWLLAIWGEVLAELNDLKGALRRTRDGVQLMERGGDLAMLGWSYLCLIRVLFACGDLARAEEIVRKIEDTAQRFYVPPWIMNLKAAWQARILLAQGSLEDASRWVDERGLDVATAPTYLHEMEYIVYARILIAQGRLDEASGLLRRLLEAAEEGGRTSRVIEIILLQALTRQAQGATGQAIIRLEQALTLAEPEGFIRAFVDEGPPMACLLAEAVSRGVAAGYARRLLAVFPGAEPEQADSSQTQASNSALIEPLSERELEVLQLIAQGLTNREIASRLYLSLNTVKVHTRNIYGKLDVHSRTQAAARAQGLGLLLPR